MSNVLAQAIGTGIEYTTAAADAGGDKVICTGREYLIVENGGGGACLVTLDNAPTVVSNFGDDTNVTLSVAAGETGIIPLNNKGRHANPNDDDKVAISYDQVTSVAVAAIKI